MLVPVPALSEPGPLPAQEPARTKIEFPTVDESRVPEGLRHAGAGADEVARSRFVELDPLAVGLQLGDAAARGESVDLVLFDDGAVTMTSAGFLRTQSSIRWTGLLEGGGGSAGWSLYTYAFGTASWWVATPGGPEYAVLPVDAGRLFRVVELSPTRVRERSLTSDTVDEPLPSGSAAPPAIATASDAVALGAVPIEGDTGPVVDVLVAYTDSARSAAGGTSQVQNEIAAAVNSANWAYTNSGVPHRLRLVHVYETTSFDGPSTLVDGLLRASTVGDGALDEVHAARDRFGADVVLIWHDFVDSCGVAYVMLSPDASFERYAFAAVDNAASCHGTWNVVAHELGHIFSSQHNIEDASSPAMVPYGYGYQRPVSPRFITVMAYASGLCVTCPKIPYFSAPTVSYAGVPVGTAGADNVRAMATTDDIVASFRQSVAATVVTIEPTPSGDGYWTVSADGVVRAFGAARQVGDLSGLALAAPIVDLAADPDGRGYWLAASDGGVFTFDAPFFGSAAAVALNSPIVGMAASPAGTGYWLVAADGGVFALGTAAFLGSMGGTPLNAPITSMARTRTGAGYWLVASDGGIFSFGDARFFGSTGAMVLNKPVVAMASTPSGGGYWLVASDGGIFSFGDAQFFGSTGTMVLNQPVVGIAATASGAGYWLVATDGGVFNFGDAVFFGAAI